MNEDVFQKAVINDLNDLNRRINAIYDINDLTEDEIKQVKKNRKEIKEGKSNTFENIDEYIKSFNDMIFSRIEKLEKDSKIVSDNLDEVISEHRAKIKSIEKQLEILHDFINDYIRKDSNRL